MLNGSDITFVPLGSLTRTIPVAEAKTSHLRADAGIRKCTIEEDLTFRIECRTIVDEG